MPEYEFILWDYDKARQIQMPWINKALEENRWAFAADAVRLYAVYSEGGIYLDSDVEALRSFDPLTNRPYFFGYENGSHRIEAATFGAEAHFPAVEKALQFYQTHFFEYKESDVDFLVIPNILAETFQNMQVPFLHKLILRDYIRFLQSCHLIRVLKCVVILLFFQ